MSVSRILHLKGIKNILYLYLVNNVLAGTRASTFEIKRKLLNSIGYEIGEGTKIVGPIEWLGHIKIGKNCWIGKNCKVNGNGTVIIGDNCDLGPEITFQTGGHLIGDSDRRAGQGLIMHQTVGNGTWIGGRVTIVGNTNIGNSCVIAGCACVIKDVEDNSLVGGVPARLLRRL